MKIKKGGMIAACVAAVLILWVAVIIYGNPFKVTDPSDPRFNPDNFSFYDYNSREELADAFRVLFPVGTPKEFVDRVLVKAGGAYPHHDKTLKNLWHYSRKLRFSYPSNNMADLFIFDEDMKVLNIIPSLTTEMYVGQTTLKDLVDVYEKELREKQMKETQNDR